MPEFFCGAFMLCLLHDATVFVNSQPFYVTFYVQTTLWQSSKLTAGTALILQTSSSHVILLDPERVFWRVPCKLSEFAVLDTGKKFGNVQHLRMLL